MEEQKSLYTHEVEIAFFPKKDTVKEPRIVILKEIQKAEYGFHAVIYAGFCGDRRLYISNTQYTYLKNKNAAEFWVKSELKGENKKTKKPEYTSKICIEKEGEYI